ncbi:AsmA-like C-terminal region-containing protein [Acetomicrobium sp.]|uniref:AsmA-like C-terminal region-containing protein n=1 Tax=Acetomicrobium sp. TaxID=1872099 RepID=UPI001BCC9934|nr:AsmA-like C-terminal region-containing protein [Acetomicrobium sp.]
MSKKFLTKRTFKTIAFLFCLFLLSLVLVASVVLKRGGDFGSAFVVEEIKKTLKNTAGLDLHFASFSGNPITGYVGSGVEIILDGNELLLAKSIEIKPSVKSLIKGNPAVKSIEINSINISKDEASRLATVISAIKETNASPPPPIEEIILKDVKISGKRNYSITQARFKPHDHSIDVDFRGEINSLKVIGKFRALRTDEKLILEDCHLKVNDTNLKLEGTLTPRISLTGEVEELGAEEIVALFPKFKAAQPKGFLSGTMAISCDDSGSIAVEGRFYVPSGEIVDIPLNSASFTMIYKEGKLNFELLENSSFETEVTGNIEVAFNPLILKLDLFSDKASTEKWQGRFPWLSSFDGTANDVRLHLKGHPRKLSGRIYFTSDEFIATELALKDAEIAADISGKEVSFKGRGYWQGIPIAMEGSALHNGSLMLDALVSAEGLEIGKLGRLFNSLSDMNLEGQCDITVKVQGKPDELALEGVAKSNRLKAGFADLRDLKMEFTLKKDGLKISSLQAKLYDGEVTGQGTVSDLFSPSPNIDLSGIARDIELGGLFDSVDPKMEGKTEVRWRISKEKEGVIFSAVAEAPALVFGDLLKLQDLHAEAASFEGGLNLKGRALFNGGKVEFLGKIKDERGELFTDISGTISDLSLEPKTWPIHGMLRGNFKAEGRSGNLSFYAKMYGQDIMVKDILLKDFKLTLGGNNSSMEVQSLSFGLCNGIVSLGGTIEGDNLHLTGDFNAVDLSGLPLPSLWFVRGIAGGKVVVEGVFTSPQIEIDGLIREAAIDGLTFETVKFKAKSDTVNLALDVTEASGENWTIKGKAKGSIKPDPTFEFEVDGDNVPIDMFSQLLSPNLKGKLKGRSKMGFAGKYDGALTCRGLIRSEELSFFDVKFQNAEIPLALSSDSLRIDDLKASLFGGTLNMNYSAQVGKLLTWQSNIDIKNAPLNAFLQNFLAESVSSDGILNLSLNLKGEGTRLVNLSGYGKLDVTDGKIVGFAEKHDGLKSIGLNSLNFQKASLDFYINGPSLYILPGSMITSQPNDSLYRYISIDGILALDGTIDLFCSGNINVKALNALTRAVREVAMLENPTEQEVAQNLLKGFISGFSLNDFKDISLHIKGSWPSLTISNLRVNEPLMAKGPLYYQFDDDEDEWKFNLHFNFPTGSGKPSEGDLGEQFVSQILEGLLNGIFNPASEDNSKKGTFSTADEIKGNH